MKLFAILCFLPAVVGSHVGYKCVCTTKDVTVFASTLEHAAIQGSMPQYECRAIVADTGTNGWAAIAFEHKIGYVRLDDDVNAGMCPGEPPINETISSTTNPTPSTTQTSISTTTITTTATTTTAVTTTCPSSTPPYKTMTTVNKQSCYEIVDHHEAWNDAEAHCKRRGGHLMHITDAQEQEFITKYLLANYNHLVWIGLGDHHHEEIFEWTSGVPLRYTHWDPSRKDSIIHGMEDCVVLRPYDHGYWDDMQCSGLFAAKHSYICQYTGQHAGVIIG